ncbi:MAG: ClpXP protease specificity-enhancing factor [Sodalis sp. (in: enterobacteria)]
MEVTQLSPRRPYLLRAFYEWLLDNQLTPYLVVNVEVDGVMVPMPFSHDGQIVLNIAPRAVANLVLNNDKVQFNARFSGVLRQLVIPITAVLAIYARENGVGTMFEPEVAYQQHLTLKNDNNAQNQATETLMSVIDDARPDNMQDDNLEPKPPTSRRAVGQPSLRVVK